MMSDKSISNTSGSSGMIGRESKGKDLSHEKCCQQSQNADYLEILCPVDGVSIGKSGPNLETPQAVLKHGARLFFCTTTCCEQFKLDVPKYMREPGDQKWIEKPCMQGLKLNCSECKNTSIKIKEHTPRVLFKYGQALFFCNFSCMASFLKNPAGAFQSTSALTGMVLGKHRAPVVNVICPVTSKKMTLETGTPYVEFSHGQKIFTCSPGCPTTLSRNLIQFLKQSHDPFIHTPQSVCNGLIQKCVHCASTLIVDEELTPRVQFKSGQNLWFKTNRCVDEFLLEPQKYLGELVDEQTRLGTSTGTGIGTGTTGYAKETSYVDKSFTPDYMGTQTITMKDVTGTGVQQPVITGATSGSTLGINR